MTPDYSVDIEPFDDQWRVVWIAGGLPYRPYFVNADHVLKLSARIRETLRKLVTRSTKGALLNGDRSAAIPILDELMKQGHRLYRTFFTDARGEKQKLADTIRQSIEARVDRPKIWFKLNAPVHVPWALMAESPAPAGQSDGSPQSYRGFWALKCSIATLYDTLVAPEDFDAPYPAGDFDTLIGVDAALHRKASGQLVGDSPEAEVFSLINQRYSVPITSFGALRSEWERRESRLGLLYLYAHSSDSRIGFSAADVLDTIDFTLDYRKRSFPPRCLVFLNGCHTATGGFLEATGRPGFCGFIGAETALPYVFAHRFGAAMIAGLYSGEPLASIIDRLRTQHWPLSMVYGLYAYPFLQLVPCFETPQFPVSNYSDLIVGSKTV